MAVQARAEATRQRIIDAAVDLFDEVGYGETGLTDIIDRSRITKGAFYYHFPTKESLAAAIMDEADARIRDAILRSTTSRALENLIRATFVVADMVKHDQRVRVGHLLEQALSQVSAAGRATYPRRLPVIVSAVNKAIADGDLLDDLNPDQVGRTIWAIGLGTLLLSDVTEEDVLVQTSQAWLFITRAIVPAQLAPYVEQFVARTAQQYTHDEPDLSAEELLKRADLAMYSGKRSRIGGVHTFKPEMQSSDTIDKALLRRGAPPLAASDGAAMVKLLGELCQAIDRLELTLVYQPKFDLRTTKIVGVEALLRWPHPERGILAPEEFLPLVRRDGLMGPVDDFVVNRVLDDAVVWHAASVDVPVAVNLFPPTLANLKLPGAIAHALAARGLSSAALTVEITEHMFLDNMERTQTVLEQLRRNGIRIAIDDFGTGYCTLSYLRDLPIDEVKLDRNFVAPILVDERTAVIVHAVVDLVHALGLTIVAEGVEDAETEARLREYGCDVVQGQFLSPPVRSEELLALLKTPATSAIGPSGPASARSS